MLNPDLENWSFEKTNTFSVSDDADRLKNVTRWLRGLSRKKKRGLAWHRVTWNRVA